MAELTPANRAQLGDYLNTALDTDQRWTTSFMVGWIVREASAADAQRLVDELERYLTADDDSDRACWWLH